MTENRLLLRLELESFKSIERLDQNLGQLTVLVGENSVGKSSFMQAIILASQIARSRTPGGDVKLNGVDVNLGDFRHLLHSGGAVDKVTISLTLRDEAASRLPSTNPSARHGCHYLRWRLIFGKPPVKKIGASLERVSLASSYLGDELSVSHLEEQRTGSGTDLASDMGLLLARSIALARAAGDTSLDIAAQIPSVERRQALFEGALRVQGARAGVGGTGSRDVRIDLVALEGGLPALALQAKGNKLAAARAFLTLSNSDGTMRESRVHNVEPALGEDLYPEGAYDELLEEFVIWLDQLDDAMRAAETLSVPTPKYSITAGMFPGVTLNMLAEKLSKETLSGYVERDHLARWPTSVIEVAEGVQGSLSRRLHLLGPLREDPSPWYRPGDKGSDIATLGPKGEFTIAYLDEHGDDLVVCPIRAEASECQSSTGVKAFEEMPLISAVHYWLRKLGIAERVRLQPTGRILEFDLIDPQTRDRRDLTSVGVGASQILPVVVLCLLAEPGDLVLLEQPELHLHPRPQQILGDFLLGISQTGRQLIVETHSEYLVNRLRRRMVEHRLDEQPDLIRLLYARRLTGATSFDELRPNKFGSFDSWPEGFFDQSTRESARIVRAASARRRADRTASE